MSDQPFVSILIPVRNEVRHLPCCLQAVCEQDYPSDQIEILVADGASDDGTFELLQEWSSQAANRYVINNLGKIVPTGMNLALREAKGEIVIRVDGHCLIASDYVSNCVRHIIEDNLDGVGGPMHTIGEDRISEVIARSMSSRFGVGNSSFRTETGQTKLADTVPFPAYTRKIIHAVGLYDEELIRNQDDEYNYRIREEGGKILLAEDVKSTYYSRGSLNKLWRQYFQYGFWKVRVLQKHPRQMSLRQFVPPAFVLSIISLMVLAFAVTWGWIPLAAILGLYLAVNLLFSISIASKDGWHLLGLLPLAFAIIHISYGLGFLIGLVKFADRWNDKTGKVPPWHH